MKTFKCVQVIVARTGLVGLLISAGGCGSASSADPAMMARGSQRAPQDPTSPRPSNKEACDACQGIWAVHGIESEATCICKTSDEGQECIDGKDCQGECLLDEDSEFHVMDQSDPPRGYYRGHCAAYDTTFGCFRHIADGIGGQVPLTAEEAGENICVD
jgi:hypothetical protein